MAQNVGSWLSGGLDSSALAALARQYSHPFYTFTAGMLGAPDVVHAQSVAEFIRSEHHVRIVQTEDLLDVLPDVICHRCRLRAAAAAARAEELFSAWLEEHAPLKAAHVLNRIRELRGGKDYDSRFGARMRGTGEYAALIAKRFAIAEKKLGFGEFPELDWLAVHPATRRPAARAVLTTPGFRRAQ